MDNHRASSCACQPLAANYFVVKSGNRVSLSGDKRRNEAACRLQPACMATKPNAGTSHIRELTNEIEKIPAAEPGAGAVLREGLETVTRMIAPMMPHLAEECWAALGRAGLVAQAPWPETEAGLLIEDEITLPVQINGKKRADVTVPRDADAKAVEVATLALAVVQTILEGRAPRKVIVVPGRIVNLVV